MEREAFYFIWKGGGRQGKNTKGGGRRVAHPIVSHPLMTETESEECQGHAKDKYVKNFSLDKRIVVAVVKKFSSQNLRQKELRFIEKYGPTPFGLNRYAGVGV